MRNVWSNIAGLVGCGVVAVGVGLIFLPAGVIAGGVLLAALAWRVQT